MTQSKAYLLLEDGAVFEGRSIGRKGTQGGEICFNTGMTGYQEIYTDPSYSGQIIVNTTPHIGNYGAIDKEQESDRPKISGLVVNDFSDIYSRKSADSSLQEYLEKSGIVGISEVDTRMIVRHIRSKGAMNAIISSDLEGDELQKELEKVPSMAGLELSSKVCCKEPFFYGDESSTYKIAVLDLGIKLSILKNLSERDCYCKVFPAKTAFEEIAKWNPDGYFISNGPGDPGVMDYAVETVRHMVDEGKPLFGICLGHQILARACDISTYKMHHGHRGINHPVKNLITGTCEVTSQNHGFSISEKDVKASNKVKVTHVNLNDDTIEGLETVDGKAFSVQYHPESSPGPHDSRYLFDRFLDLLKKHK